MSLYAGSLDELGHPVFDITVRGTDANGVHRCRALIDTGFTGYVMLPLQTAESLGLVRCGTTTYTLADGKAMTSPIASGAVALSHGEDALFVDGVVVLSSFASNPPLLGMEFLRRHKKLLVAGSKVLLIDEEALDL